jgi:Rieske Fe-S protein
MSNDSTSRRRFLAVVTQGSLALGTARLGVGCSSSSGIGGKYAAGNVSTLQVGDLRVAPSGPLAIGRDAGGVYAMTLICTHNACDMSTRGAVSSQGVVCNCHGSQFDVDGNPVSGPAHTPLQHYEVTIDASGNMTIDGDVEVSESTRTPVH